MGSVACCNPVDGKGGPLLASVPVTNISNDGRVSEAFVTLVGARGVQSSSWLPGESTCEMYCTMLLGGEEVFRSETLANMMEPLWRQETKITGWTADRHLEVLVYNGKDCIGNTTLDLPTCQQGLNREVSLESSEGSTVAYLRLKVCFNSNRNYPKGPRSEFTATVQRDSTNMKWGMRLDPQDATKLLVENVEESGPVGIWNGTALPDHHVRKSDMIVATGPMSGDAAVMLQEFTSRTQLAMTVRRSVEIVVFLKRTRADMPWGLDFPPNPKGASLVIANLLPGHSLINEYNSRQQDASLQVQTGDRILAVNGVVGTAKLIRSKLLSSVGTIRLAIQRCTPSPASGELACGLAYWRFWD